MIKDLVSIVTPCYNGEEFIARFLESVLNQTYPKLELIIINDGSNDQTEEIIQSYQRRFADRGINIIYRCQENAGQAAALNRGLKLFNGEYMTWVDSDDELMPEYVLAKVEYLKAHPQCAFCYGKILFADENEPDVIVDEMTERKSKMQKSFIDCLVIDVKEICFTGYMVRSEKLVRSDIADRTTEVSQRYLRGKAASKVKLHHQEMMLAQVGSPLAIENAHRNLLDMEDDE